VSVYCRGPERRTREEVVDGVRCVWTPGVDRKAVSTLSYGLTASIDSVKHRPDAALVLNVANGFYLPMLRRAGIPTAVNVDGMEWERAKWNAAGKKLFQWGASLTARYADEIVVDSKAIGAVWKSMFGVDSNFIPYGAPVVSDHGSARVEALGLIPGTYVLAVARLVPENNVEILLEGLRMIGAGVPTVIVGSAPAPTNLERELAQLSSSSPNFHWLGHVGDQELLTELWRNCGVYYHGHSVGGTNPALLQALGCGSPTVAIDTPFNREVIEHADHLCAADAGAVAEKVGAVLSDPDLRSRMAGRGRRIVADRYQWDDVCASYTDLLLRLAEASLEVPSPVGGARLAVG
jgi:glycosyltransferase involved in cell wall biosynthesis